ncbi:MAG: hypothetical protein JWQ28_1059 [Pedobacter sp.]|jgi:hypothetical protein|nr:hypothetical protein [Pedobacter sp.]
MKKIMVIALLSMVCSLAKAQFTNTKWNGALAVPDTTGVILDFKKDLVTVIVDQSGEVLETMSYTVHADTLIFKKVSGQSPCSETLLSKLRFSIADNQLTIIPVSDDCQVRADAWTKKPFVKVAEKAD